MKSAQKSTVFKPPLQPKQKNVVLAYLLWFFFGVLGVHNFYLKRYRLAVAELIAGVLVFPSFYLTGFILVPLLIFDLFTIPAAARRIGPVYDHADPEYNHFNSQGYS